MRVTIFTAVLCTAVVSQIDTASAQYYGPPGGYYYYGSPAALYPVLTPVDLGWFYTRNQPAQQLPTDTRQLVPAHLVKLEIVN